MLEKLNTIKDSLGFLYPEIVLTAGVLLLICFSFFKNIKASFASAFAIVICATVIILIFNDLRPALSLFGGILQKENLSDAFKILINISAILTCLMSLKKNEENKSFNPEYYALILSILLGGHFLLMSNNLLMVFLSLEIISISSYILAGFGADRKGSEGSLKYFLFGSVASALMLYGFTLLYGISGTLDFSSESFARALIENDSPLLLIAGFMALAGMFFKISAAPMHLWTPDVYESAPMPVVAFFSVAPKLAGLGILAKFILAINAYSQTSADWQVLLASVTILTLLIGNFAALAQKNAKRMMAYSSIAQSGFLLIGIVAFLPQGIQFMVFYATVYVVMNYLVFLFLQYFESRGIADIEAFKGIGKSAVFPSICLLIGLIALTGLPPTAGFTGKLFIFSALWESYQLSQKPILLWLLIFGLLNTVVSLFYYLKIPYFSFIKEGQHAEKQNFLIPENLLGLILVVVILSFFFLPGVLMGWINKVNFVF
jgi:NADH-quinone oxidoreductase subunit N